MNEEKQIVENIIRDSKSEEMMQGLKVDHNFKFWYDDSNEKNMAYIAIPIKHIAKDHNLGTIMLRGWMEQVKEELLMWIKLMRAQEAKNGIIKPGTPPMKVVS